MSRQKVPDDKRQRTAQACDYCKRRKQKCDGMKPCSTCTKKNVTCTYAAGNTRRPTETDDVSASPPKRRHVDKSGCSESPANVEGETKPRVWSRKKDVSIELETSFLQHQPHHTRLNESAEAHEDGRRLYVVSESALEDHVQTSTTSGQDEEAVLVHTTRLLQDQTGRLLYIGDSATLSYLHLFRLMVESISGHSSFTTDPRKENIVENIVSLPPTVRPPTMLADRQTADLLVESFFTNTSGLVEVFDRRDFFAELDACYANPLSANNQFLCLLFLTFAIGLVMATPETGSAEETIVRRLHGQPFDQAELFFRSAKCLGDPLNGLEDADFWSVQALSLMSIYMLAVSKRNAAFAYHGMAVRSAIALGLHREETMVKFKGSELRARCNIWKSLYVLDRFIAASLGRPSAINEDECTEAALKDAFMPHISPILGQTDTTASSETELHMLGVNATVRSCRIIGAILKKLYARRRVSTRATQDIVRQCGIWTRDLHECLRWQRAMANCSAPEGSRGQAQRIPRAQSIAILHVNLLYCHSIILLTRPFFLFLIQADRRGKGRVTPYLRTRTEKFSEVCITASYHTITMIQSALEANYLPQRNPFVMYFLFTAALLIMSNEFIALFHNPTYGTYIGQAISLMEYFSSTDPQGKRLLWILSALEDVVIKQSAEDALPGGNTRPFRYQYPKAFINGTTDPIQNFFASPPVPSAWNHGTTDSNTSTFVELSGNLGKRSASERSHALQPPRTETNCLPHIDANYLQRHDSTASLQSGTAIHAVSTSSTNVDMMSGRLTHPLSPSPDASSFGGNMFRTAAPGFQHSAQPLHPPVLPHPFALSAPQPQHLHFHSGGSPGGYRPVDSKPGDTDGTDSIGTDGEGFDFDTLWNWPNAVGPEGAAPASVATAVPVGPSSLGVPQEYPSAHGDMSHYVVGERVGEHRAQGAMGAKHGPLPVSQLPPIYSPYGIALSAGGGGISTPGTHGNSMLTTPINVPLYPTADFG